MFFIEQLGIFFLVVGLLIGGFFGYVIRKLIAIKRRDAVETKVEQLLNEAKTKEKEILLDANDKALKVIEKGKQEVEKEKEEVKAMRHRVEQRESMFDQKLLDLENNKQELLEKAKRVDEIKAEVKEIKVKQLEKLEAVARLSRDEAVKKLLEQVEREANEDVKARMKKLIEHGNEQIESKAKDLMALAIMRCASTHTSDLTTTNVEIPSDEMKGRIIGKEGRNIKTLENLTGVEILIDETPNMIMISGFSPIRRQVAKGALDKLIVDGRIHPGRIEEAVEEAKRELAGEIRKAGEDALLEFGITGIDPKLTQILGRLKFRTSYGQNNLVHAKEVAHIAGLLAAELGADVALCKKGGLFHDIGKAVDHDIQGGHPEIGYDIMKKFGMPEELAYMCIGHHEDNPITLEGVIVKSADAISGSRPGARKDSYENYLQRLEELEKVATSFDGVDKAYAIQAGREIRVFVRPEAVDDVQATKMAQQIARQIESELKYPGEIKVVLIRENRVIEYAR
ncbi:MAG: ribonuclease Y [Candidatus Buchananbacteria bacterium CG10_big_fil_rev_8_21_14_0_10_42_9]|uniref:Ribonuclease Y n=1 Tax=Candidatus Buchananbacteria bacterium CG10_big_fil_rev_8_21_14_0_10_42_9 TaxID=1974526 RepID=A0A2H0W0N8_9BACT|nr:MAG: ribonuclease Y [Candidatus Buchananbacteria bacterium CG10_big_fil_rev_8_21_14_0_10_42_9]